MRLLHKELEKSSTWFGATLFCLFVGITGKITIDSTPLIVILFAKTWGFVAFNTLGSLAIGILCGIREELARRKSLSNFERSK